MKKRILVVVGIVAVAIALAPLVVGAATESEILNTLDAVIKGVLSAGKDAYCAFGVTAFFP